MCEKDRKNVARGSGILSRFSSAAGFVLWGQTQRRRGAWRTAREGEGNKKKELKRERTIINVVGQEEEEKIDERDVVKNKTTTTTM